MATSVGDEGGFAPNLASNEDAIEIIIEAIKKSGYKPGIDISIALDSAATSFVVGKQGKYDLKWSGAGIKTSDELIDMAKEWIKKYPIILWEDPLAEEDWDGFKKFTKELGDKIEVVGDDIFVTNTKFIEKGIKEKTANASLVKLNQIGTVSETVDAVRLCYEHNWRAFVSHRSGETCDTFLADFTVALGTGHLKTGSSSRSERLAKYNRLLEIEDKLGDRAKYYWK